MSDPTQPRPKPLLFLWSTLAAPPLAWLMMFALFSGFTNHACAHLSISTFVTVGILGCVVATLAGLAAYARLARIGSEPGSVEDVRAHRTRFMLGMAIGLGAMFLLLIGVSTLPVFWLSACPT